MLMLSYLIGCSSDMEYASAVMRDSEESYGATDDASDGYMEEPAGDSK